MVYNFWSNKGAKRRQEKPDASLQASRLSSRITFTLYSSRNYIRIQNMLTLLIILVLYYFIFLLISLWADAQRKLSLVGSVRLFIKIFFKVYRRKRASKSDASSELLSKLKSDDIFIRESTISKLGKEKSEKALNALIETTLHDEHAQVRLHTVETLANINNSKSVLNALIDVAVIDQESSIRAKATSLLGKHHLDGAVSGLTDKLQSEDKSIRARVATALGELKSNRAAGVLMKMLDDEEPSVRQSVLLALGAHGKENVVDVIVKSALKDDSVEVRKNAIEVLGMFASNNGAINGLMEVLKNEEYVELRGNAIEILGFDTTKSEHAVGGVIDALSDENKNIRAKAALALGKIGSNRSIGVLKKALKDSETEVRRNVASALGRIKPEDALEELTLAATTDEDGGVRAMATESLGKILRNEKIFDALVQIALLDERSDESKRAVNALIESLSDEDKNVRIQAAVALGKIKSDTASEALLASASKDEEASVRLKTIEVLSNMGTQSALDTLVTLVSGEQKAREQQQAVNAIIGMLESDDSRTRAQAALKLKDFKSVNAIEALKKSLNDSEWEVRQNATSALGNMESEGVVTTLIPIALKDESAAVRKEATEAISGIQTESAIFALTQIASNKEYDSEHNLACDALREMLSSTQKYIRALAASALGKIKIGYTVHSLEKVLEDEEWEVRLNAVSAIGQINPERARDKLLERASKDANATVRWTAVEALGKISKDTIAENLVDIALADEDNSVRVKAASVLGQMKSDKTLEILREKMRSEDTSTRARAVYVLREMGV